MTCPYAVYSGDQGFITDEQDVVVVLAFSEPVTGLRAESLEIAGPSGATISGLKLLRGTNTFYHFVVNLPGIYYDIVTVNLEVNSLCIATSHARPVTLFRINLRMLLWASLSTSLAATWECDPVSICEHLDHLTHATIIGWDIGSAYCSASTVSLKLRA